MRIGGLASGMDIDAIVEKLMSAERMPLDRMHQDRTLLEWKRDGFRDINKALFKLDDLMFEMKRSKNYNPKTAVSSQENAVTAIAASGVPKGSYDIEVQQLAKNAINFSEPLGIDPKQKLGEIDGMPLGEFSFTTFDEDGKEKVHTFEVTAEDTLTDVLNRITSADNDVRAFYDTQSKRVILETTRTGKYNPDENGKEIVFDAQDNAFFSNVLQLDAANEKGGQNAKFIYNGELELESKDNEYQLNGITFQFKNVTEGNATITIDHDVDSTFDLIMNFVNTYNEVVEVMNKSQQEEKFRDFKPLTDAQKKEMSEDEIKKWEEKAKSGLLRGESAISNGLYDIRSSWYSKVDTGGAFTTLTQVGIQTSSAYRDGGKLVVNEEKLKEALRNDPDSVQKLFTNNAKDGSRGLVNRLEDSIDSTMKAIETKAGKSTSTLENYTLGKQMKDLNERITTFEKRLVRLESRYWSQFTAMEKAISNMNSQADYLMSQFG